MRLLSTLLLLLAPVRALSEAAKPIEIKAVVIAMFEAGEDTGDAPGEFQYWVEREHLTEVMPFPQGYHALRLNPQTGVLGIVTGVGNSRAAASVMALGLDPRFDLSHAYLLVAGIAGIDPHVGSLASVVWCDHIIDGDLIHEIDGREIPNATEADRRLWSTGYVPLGKETPYQQPRTDRFGDDGIRYTLNPTLTAWAFALTREVPLIDNPGIAARRLQYLTTDRDSPAHRPPMVLVGANLAASTFWHGKLMSEWAHNWVDYQTNHEATYTVTGMEDSGTLQAITFLANAHRVDRDRVLVLRAASNFDQQRDGVSATASLAETKIRQYSAYLPSLENAYRVGHVALDALVENWPQTRDHIPSPAQK